MREPLFATAPLFDIEHIKKINTINKTLTWGCLPWHAVLQIMINVITMQLPTKAPKAL